MPRLQGLYSRVYNPEYLLTIGQLMLVVSIKLYNFCRVAECGTSYLPLNLRLANEQTEFIFSKP